MNAPRVVVLGWGNPSRGDDALGPEFLADAERLAASSHGHFAFVSDYQLQPEHATDLLGRDLALFVDASRTLEAAVRLRQIAPRRDVTFTTHGMSGEAVLAAYVAAFGDPAPPAFELAIRGREFALGAAMSEDARHALDVALMLFEQLAATPNEDAWRGIAQDALAFD
jgi:hydrogenase maturation protease